MFELIEYADIQARGAGLSTLEAGTHGAWFPSQVHQETGLAVACHFHCRDSETNCRVRGRCV